MLVGYLLTIHPLLSPCLDLCHLFLNVNLFVLSLNSCTFSSSSLSALFFCLPKQKKNIFSLSPFLYNGLVDQPIVVRFFFIESQTRRRRGFLHLGSLVTLMNSKAQRVHGFVFVCMCVAQPAWLAGVQWRDEVKCQIYHRPDNTHHRHRKERSPRKKYLFF